MSKYTNYIYIEKDVYLWIGPHRNLRICIRFPVKNRRKIRFGHRNDLSEELDSWILCLTHGFTAHCILFYRWVVNKLHVHVNVRACIHELYVYVALDCGRTEDLRETIVRRGRLRLFKDNKQGF